MEGSDFQKRNEMRERFCILLSVIQSQKYVEHGEISCGAVRINSISAIIKVL